jgi:PAS domain-containing protein
VLKVSRESNYISDTASDPVGSLFSVGSIGPLAGYFLEASTQAASIKDSDGRSVYVNLEFEKTFGVSTETARGLTDKELFDINTATVLSRKDSQTLVNSQSSKLIETINLAKMGSHDFTVFKFRFGDSSGRHFVGTVLFDVTDTRRAFRLVTESQHRLKAAIEAGFDSFIAMEPIRDAVGKVTDFRIVDVNRNAEKLVSKSRW